MIWRCSISCLVLCSSLLVGSPVQRTQSPLAEAMTSIANDLASCGAVSWTSTAHAMMGAKWTTTNSLEQINTDPSSCLLAWTSVDANPQEQVRETYNVPLQAVLSIQVRPYSLSSPFEAQWDLKFSPETYLVGMVSGKIICGRRQLFKKSKLKSDTELPNNHEASIRFLEERTATRIAEEIRRAANLCGSAPS